MSKPIVSAVLCLVALACGVAWYQQPAFRQARLNQRLVADVTAGDLAGVRADLATGADPNAHDFVSPAPDARARLMSYLQPAQDPLPPRYWQPVLAQAAGTGDVRIVQVLLNAGAKVNGRDSFGNEATLATGAWSLRPGTANPAVLALLLRQGADGSAKNYALHETVWAGGDTHLMAMLLDSGSDANDQMSGFTPLFEAIARNQAASAKLLLARGADPNVRGRGMRIFLLTFARRQKNQPFVRMLEKAGARP